VSHRQPQAPPATGFFFVGALGTIPDWPRCRLTLNRAVLSALAANSPLPIRRTIVGHLREVTTMIDFRPAKFWVTGGIFNAMPDCSLASLPSLSASTCTSGSRRNMLREPIYQTLCLSDTAPTGEGRRDEQSGRISAARPTMLGRCPKNPERRAAGNHASNSADLDAPWGKRRRSSSGTAAAGSA
jgi:hypothetical protein